MYRTVSLLGKKKKLEYSHESGISGGEHSRGYSKVLWLSRTNHHLIPRGSQHSDEKKIVIATNALQGKTSEDNWGRDLGGDYRKKAIRLWRNRSWLKNELKIAKRAKETPTD